MQFQDELAINIDNVVSRNETIVLVGGLKYHYFEDVEKQRLETILTPYGLEVQNKEIPTRISRNTFTRSLIDYMIADNFTVNSTIVIDNAVFSDHFAVLGFSKYKKISKQLSTIKTFFDKKDYEAEQFRLTLYSSNWDKLYQTSDIDAMFNLFTNTFVQGLEKHAPTKKCFIIFLIENFFLYQKNGYLIPQDS